MNSQYNKCIIVFFLFFIGNNEFAFSQIRNSEKGNIMRVDMDTLTSYEEKIKKTNILFKVPPDFYLCKRDSIKISDVTFSYLMNVFNQNPGILQSKDQEMIVFLYGPRLFVNSSGYDWKRYARHIDNLAYHDFMPRIKKYPSKIAKKLFNADSLFVWERMPKGTENVFVIDTVDLGRKFVERLDQNYRIEDEVFWQYYPYCKTMLIKKNNVGFIFVYLYFTKRGIKYENKYIHTLKRMFWFP